MCCMPRGRLKSSSLSDDLERRVFYRKKLPIKIEAYIGFFKS
ncbi:hypothetical protein HMPREF1051_1791 [Neisseria sicca VK64]|uniref:Uncharacterized protein n=1 Tax=Neisseria sicca VK64 TaxID=1095748 RepID=I2NII3_NEISI|nr:hypothetical protein HMPREF1051_1791 [Neisseria sicca VK64]